MCTLSTKSCSNNEILSKTRGSHAIKVRHKKMQKYNLPASTHFCDKPTTYSNSCNYISCDKMLGKDCNTTFDAESQHICSNDFKIKSLQKKSIKLQTCERTEQFTSKTNTQCLVNSKYKSECYISMQVKGGKEYKTNKSKNIDQSKKKIYKKTKKQRTTEAVSHFEINGDNKQKLYYVQKKYKKCTKKIVRNECFKETSGKENINNFSRNTLIELNTNDIEMKNKMIMHKNHMDCKELIVPLIKLEDLPLSELSTLICVPKYIESRSRPKKQENNISCQTKSTTKIYKQYRTSTLEHNQEIQVLCHTPIFETNVTNIKKNIINQIDRKITNIKFETKRYEMCQKNEINSRQILQTTNSNLQSTHSLQNMLQFFMQYKTNKIKKERKCKSKIINLKQFHKRQVWKSVAMCAKCKEVFRLLQQFSDKTNFLKDEKLCVKCILCDIEINSLSCFQQHVMDVHLQCERKLLNTQGKFAVEIITFNEELNLSNNAKVIFQCYCCMKQFNLITNFEKHINKTHCVSNDFLNSITKYRTEELIENSELYATHKNEQIFNENQALNRDVTFNITTNATEIFNQKEEKNVQHSIHMNKYYFNAKDICHNSFDNNLLSKMEKHKQINLTSQSSITQINKETSSIKDHMADPNIDGNSSTLNNILKIPLISKECSNTYGSKPNQGCRGRKKSKNYFPYVCNICLKQYKRKNMFLSHMSKHVTNINTNTYQEKQAQETVKDDNIIKFESGLIVANTYNKYFQEYINNSKNNNTLNSTINLEEINESNLISEIIDKEMDNVKCENIVSVMKEDNIMLEADNDCKCILHVNLTQNLGKGIKRKKSMKFNINITKRYKPNTNSIYNTNEGNAITYISKEMCCYVCDKKFNSETMLKEHMFILHNIFVKNSNLSNISMIYFKNFRKTENLSVKDNYVFKEECNVSSETQISKSFLHNENKMYKKPIYQICSKNSINTRNKKWRCNPCKENFALLRNYLRHKYYNHNDESVVHICDNCNKVLTSVAMVNIHLCIGVTSWNCKRCHLNFSNSMSLTQHNMNNHLETIGPHTCKICKLSFLTTYMLEKHMSTHPVNDYNNLNNYVDSSVSTENYLPYILLNNKNANTEFVMEKQPIVDKTACCTNTSIENLEELNELSGMLSNMYITSNIPCNGVEILQCKLCYTSCITKIQMKLHLENWHNLKIDICQICNDLYFVDELTKHLISHHIVFDNLFLTENDTDRQITTQNNLITALGLKRLLSLYEYQRFDDISQSKCFSCASCSKQLTSIQCYKIHYLQYHDIICLLCNIEFEDNFQAFKHKTKIHTSIDLYLWVVQNLTLAILQLNEYGNNIEEIILKCSETRG